MSCSEASKLAAGLPRVENAHAAAAEQVFQHRHRDEDAVAIARKTLRLDDRPGVRRRRDVGIGGVLVAERLRHQERRVGAVGGLDIPARQIASGREPVAFTNRRANQQQRADGTVAAFEQVTIFRETRRRLTARQPVQARPTRTAACGSETRARGALRRRQCRLRRSDGSGLPERNSPFALTTVAS